MSGVLTAANIIDCATWGAAFVQGNNAIPIQSESLTKTYDQLRSEALIGSASQHEFENGRVLVSGDLTVDADYDEMALLEYCMGDVSGGTYSFTDTVDDFFHLEIDKYLNRHRFQSCYVDGFTLSGAAGDTTPLALSMKVTAYDKAISSVALATTTKPSARAFFDHLSYFRIGDQADALTSADNMPIKSMELGAERAGQTDGKDSSLPSNVLQPVPNGFRTASLKIGLARYAAVSGMVSPEQIATWRDAGTRLQATFLFSGAGGTITIFIPEMKISGGGDFSVGGPGVLEDEVTFELFKNNNNTPMSTVTDQFEIVVA